MPVTTAALASLEGRKELVEAKGQAVGWNPVLGKAWAEASSNFTGNPMSLKPNTLVG